MFDTLCCFRYLCCFKYTSICFERILETLLNHDQFQSLRRFKMFAMFNALESTNAFHTELCFSVQFRITTSAAYFALNHNRLIFIQMINYIGNNQSDSNKLRFTLDFILSIFFFNFIYFSSIIYFSEATHMYFKLNVLFVSD